MNANSIHNALILIGIILLTYATQQFRAARSLLKSGHIVPAEVTDLGAYTDSDGDQMYKPIITFETQNGDTMQWQQSFASNVLSFAIGEQVQVIYDTTHAQQPRIFSFWGLLRNTILATCLGLSLLAIGLGYFIFEGYFGC